MAGGRLDEGVLVAGRYALREALGEGGFGEVWKAHDQRFGRAVAVKFMRPQLVANASLRRRFERESRALAAINHPNVVQVFDDGEWEGRPFVVLEYIEGGTLRDWLESHRKLRKGTPLDEVRVLFGQVCEGVAAAHRVQIVHRDLKPENVLIAYDAEGGAVAKVLDFGLARVGEGQSSVALQVGTYAYMSPEQAAEGSDAVGATSDVFSLGVMLVEMLTGRVLPDEASKAPWERAVLAGRAPGAFARLRGLRAEVPEGLWLLAERALSQEPTQRFANAAEMRRSVEVAWGGASVAPGRASIPQAQPPAAPQGPMPSVALMPSMALPAHGASAPPMAPTIPMAVPSVQPPWSASSTPQWTSPPGWVPPRVVADEPGRRAWPSATPPVKRRRWVLAFVALGLVGLCVVAVVAVTTGPSVPVGRTLGPVPACPEGMVGVPAGNYWMGSPTGQGADSERPQRLVQLGAFCMDRTEVTVAAYRGCVAAGRCAAAGTDQYCNGGRSDRDNHPINCVDWTQAEAFCRSRDAQLPTEAQWEYAARGTDGRTYPWGNDAPGSQLCWRQSSTCPVGSYRSGDSPFRLSDMAGNVWEWTSDWYGAYPAPAGPVVSDPTGPGSGENRVFRGGGWYDDDAAWARAAVRLGNAPANRVNDLGFRCARGAR